MSNLALPAADRSFPAASSGSATVSSLANSASADAANESSLSVSCFSSCNNEAKNVNKRFFRHALFQLGVPS